MSNVLELDAVRRVDETLESGSESLHPTDTVGVSVTDRHLGPHLTFSPTRCRHERGGGGTYGYE